MEAGSRVGAIQDGSLRYPRTLLRTAQWPAEGWSQGTRTEIKPFLVPLPTVTTCLGVGHKAEKSLLKTRGENLRGNPAFRLKGRESDLKSQKAESPSPGE